MAKCLRDVFFLISVACFAVCITFLAAHVLGTGRHKPDNLYDWAESHSVTGKALTDFDFDFNAKEQVGTSKDFEPKPEAIPAPGESRIKSAAESIFDAVGEKAVKEVKGCIRVEFPNVTEDNSIAHEDTRTYSGLCQPYDKDGKPLGRWGHWSGKTTLKLGHWVVDKVSVQFEQPEPIPVPKK